MAKVSPDQERLFISAWKNASELLAKLRSKELRATDTLSGLVSLLPAFEKCCRETELSTTSGLIEQQRIFARSKKK